MFLLSNQPPWERYALCLTDSGSPVSGRTPFSGFSFLNPTKPFSPERFSIVKQIGDIRKEIRGYFWRKTDEELRKNASYLEKVLALCYFKGFWEN